MEQARYSVRLVRFVQEHREEFETAYTNPGAEASHTLERLWREFVTLPSRHSCSCWGNHCVACRKLSEQRTRQDVAVSIGRTEQPYPPMPAALMLDMHRAMAALGARGSTPVAIARYLNGESRG